MYGAAHLPWCWLVWSRLEDGGVVIAATESCSHVIDVHALAVNIERLRQASAFGARIMEPGSPGTKPRRIGCGGRSSRPVSRWKRIRLPALPRHLIIPQSGSFARHRDCFESPGLEIPLAAMHRAL